MASDDPSSTRAANQVRRPQWWIVCLFLISAAALILRVWSLDHGLPYAWNIDEATHFAPGAVQTALYGWNPHYFNNPPGFTYLLRAIFEVGWGKEGLIVQWAADPSPMLLAARWASAVLGALACLMLGIAGRRLFGRLAGLAAAALLAVAFLPVAYSHYALNDVPALAAIGLSLIGIAGIAKGSDRWIDWVLAGVGVGAAIGIKYTAGVVIISLLVAVHPRWRSAAGRLAVTGLVALLTCLAANPYSLLAWNEFSSGIALQQAHGSAPQAGRWTTNPLVYYGDVLTWGLGLLPTAASAIGAVLLGRRSRRYLLMMVLPPLALLIALSGDMLVSGSGHMNARWLLPAFPFICLLCGVTVSFAAQAVGKHSTSAAPPILATIGLLAVLAAQGVLLSVRTDLVLGRTDTRQQLRDWMVPNVPRGTLIEAEAFSLPPDWYANPPWAKPVAPGPAGAIWNVAGEFDRNRDPGLVDRLRSEGRCRVLVSSNVSGRASVRPARTAAASAWYARLRRESTILFAASPWASGHRADFDFDEQYLYFAGARRSPGPSVELRLIDRCRQRIG